MRGGGCFSDWGASFLSGGVPWGDIGFDGRGFQKKSLDGGGGGLPPTMGNSAGTTCLDECFLFHLIT